MRAAEDVMTGRERPLDVGRFNGRCFSYVASFGAFTKASYATPQTVKNALGHLAYILEGVKDIPQIRPHFIRVETAERSVEGEYIFGAVSNSTSLGGVLALDPQVVDMADGLFEIFLIKTPPNAAALANAVRNLLQKNYDDPMIEFIKTSRARVFAPPDMDWSLDGERQPGCERAEIENLHGVIRLLVKE
jgi:diacylglycerol kinase family enzyme